MDWEGEAPAEPEDAICLSHESDWRHEADLR